MESLRANGKQALCDWHCAMPAHLLQPPSFVWAPCLKVRNVAAMVTFACSHKLQIGMAKSSIWSTLFERTQSSNRARGSRFACILHAALCRIGITRCRGIHCGADIPNSPPRFRTSTFACELWQAYSTGPAGNMHLRPSHQVDLGRHLSLAGIYPVQHVRASCKYDRARAYAINLAACVSAFGLVVSFFCQHVPLSSLPCFGSLNQLPRRLQRHSPSQRR